MKILILDNYDSFTYNLVQYVKELTGNKIDVIRNDKIELEEVEKYDTIILSPGPGLPKDAGIMLELIKKYAATKSILGVCLGHQAIAEAFGGQLYNLEKVFHGIPTMMKQTGERSPIFKNIPLDFEAGRYHSWVVEKKSLPKEFLITVVDEAGEIMAMRHKKYNLAGIQFHPESIMTKHGKQMLANFLKIDFGEALDYSPLAVSEK